MHMARAFFDSEQGKNSQFRCKRVTPHSFLKIKSEKAALWPKGINISNLDLIGMKLFQILNLEKFETPPDALKRERSNGS